MAIAQQQIQHRLWAANLNEPIALKTQNGFGAGQKSRRAILRAEIIGSTRTCQPVEPQTDSQA